MQCSDHKQKKRLCEQKPLWTWHFKDTKCLQMAYNRRNILKRIVEIQNLTLEHTSRGVTQVWVYEHVIYPRFVISISTYNSYLSINAKKMLSDVEEQQAKQLKLF